MCHVKINVIRLKINHIVGDFNPNTTDQKRVNTEHHIHVVLQIVKQIPGLVGILLITEAENNAFLKTMICILLQGITV